jgi:hypothetical protein
MKASSTWGLTRTDLPGSLTTGSFPESTHDLTVQTLTAQSLAQSSKVRSGRIGGHGAGKVRLRDRVFRGDSGRSVDSESSALPPTTPACVRSPLEPGRTKRALTRQTRGTGKGQDKRCSAFSEKTAGAQHTPRRMSYLS